MGVGLAHLAKGEFEASLAWSLRSLAVNADWLGAHWALASAYALAARHLPSFPRITMFLVASAQLTFLGIATGVLSYAAATPALPLQDAALAQADAALGFDWAAYYRFFVERPTLFPYATLFYASIAFAAVIPFALAAVGDKLRLQRFVHGTGVRRQRTGRLRGYRCRRGHRRCGLRRQRPPP